MYFWNIKKLNKDLVKGLEPKEDLKYILAFTILMESLFFIDNGDVNIYDHISTFLEIIISVIWTIYLFKLNWWNEWKNFLSRLFSIWFVTMNRSFVFFFIPLFIITFSLQSFYYSWMDNVPYDTDIFVVFFVTIFLLLNLYLYVKYWKDLMKNFNKNNS